MALIEGTDFVFAPRGTFVTTDVSAVNVCSIVGTRRHLFVVMENVFEADSSKTVETTYSFGGRKPAEALRDLFNDAGMTLEKLQEVLGQMTKGDSKFCVELDKLSEFKVKSGWFSRGIYCKQQGAWGYSPAAVINDKAVIQKFQAFYGQ